LRHGADGSIKNGQGQTALDLAKKGPDSSDRQTIVRLLAASGAVESVHR
jgi:hypothetical protein